MRLNVMRYLLILFLFSGVSPLFAQLSEGGIPASQMSRASDQPEQISLTRPDVPTLLLEDDKLMQGGGPERVGITLKVGYNIHENKTWTNTGNGSHYTRILITAPGASGMGLYFSDFKLPERARLFVYTPDFSRKLGSFTQNNNSPDGYFATELLPGDSIIIEYEAPLDIVDGFVIDEALYMYRPLPGDIADRSGNCQVNVACSEGESWREQIKSVVRIMIKNGNSNFWCSGALLNNTAADFKPLILTADHCAESMGNYATPADVARWIFYFQYQTPDCENVIITETKSLTGGIKLASSSPKQNNGSDFYLVSLNNPVPGDYLPYYAGWDITGISSASGVSIHHPGGDVKKISTYTKPLTNTQWGNTSGTHFKVNWSETEHGHGTTEGGSSGSPLFGSNGLIIGQLTGGESSCSQTSAPDYYGKISFSWNSNGVPDSTRLQPWLDPLNLGLDKLSGSYNTNQPLARFKADTTMIGVGGKIRFTNLSLGNPSSYYWEFEGGEPSTSTQADLPEVTYRNTGAYSVKLRIVNMYGADSLIREQYVKVVPNVFPNPTTGLVTAFSGANGKELISVTVTNIPGQVVRQFLPPFKSSTLAEIDLGALSSGCYLITIIDVNGSNTYKLIKSPY